MSGKWEGAHRPAGGFTVLELAAVLAVMAIAACLALPDVMTLRRGLELESAAREMFCSLRAAQWRSVTSGRRVRLAVGAPSGDGLSWRIETDACGAWVADGGAHRVPPGIDVTVAGPSPKIFYPDGTSSIGSLTLAAPGGRYYRLALTPMTGRVRLWRGAVEVGRAR